MRGFWIILSTFRTYMNQGTSEIKCKFWLKCNCTRSSLKYKICIGAGLIRKGSRFSITNMDSCWNLNQSLMSLMVLKDTCAL